MSTRDVRYSVVAGVGYSFLVSILTLGLEALANIFYPIPLALSPLWSLYKGYWISFLLTLALYGLLIIFTRPYKSEYLMGYAGLLRLMQRIVIFTIIALAVLSMFFDMYNGPLRTRIGLFIVINVISGVIGGYLGVVLSH
jgi:predicted membrane metal-binding protein